MTTDSIAQKIRQHYAELSAADRKLADLLLRQQAGLVGYSATELADLAGVSKASAARFFRRLGFADFQAFRAELRRGAAQQSPLHRMRQTARKTGTPQFAQHIEADTANLAALREAVDDATVDATAELLARARSVFIVGYRNSHATAFYAAAILSQIRPGVQLLDDAAGHQAEQLADCGPQDVLLVADFRRRTSRLLPLVTAARAAGMRVIVLTDTPLSDLTAQAALVLHCPHQDEQMFDSYVGAISLVNFLATATTARVRKPARARMQRIEELHRALGDFADAS